jgi:glycosyltransferase involved in cell wall biosynthesis
MRIGFDAKRAFFNTTGLGNYSRGIIYGLNKFKPDVQQVLYTPKPSKLFSFDNKVTVKLPEQFLHKKLKSLWRSRWVSNQLAQDGIDLFHGLSHEIPVGITKTKIPSVVTIHDLISVLYPKQYGLINSRLYNYKMRYACKNANKIIAISNQTANDMVTYFGTPAHKIETILQTCHPQFQEANFSTEVLQKIKTQYQLPKQFFLFVGSLIERKNLLGILKAMLSIPTSKRLPLVVIGTGNEYAACKQFVSENQLGSWVIFQSYINPVSFEHLPYVYNLSTALVYPSMYEGFGIPIVEAFFSETAVITSNISCMPQVAGNAAALVNPYQPKEIANAIIEIAENTNIRQSLIQKGKERQAVFNYEAYINTMYNFYKNML